MTCAAPGSVLDSFHLLVAMDSTTAPPKQLMDCTRAPTRPAGSRGCEEEAQVMPSLGSSRREAKLAGHTSAMTLQAAAAAHFLHHQPDDDKLHFPTLTDILQAGDSLQAINIHHAGRERGATSERALHQIMLIA